MGRYEINYSNNLTKPKNNAIILQLQNKYRGVAQLAARLLWAKPAKRARWAKQRAGFGAAVKILKANAA